LRISILEDDPDQLALLKRWLADDGQVLLKFWMHISKAEQKKRFRAYLNDPAMKWKITKEYKRHHADYEKWTEAVEEMLAKTDSPHAPWTVVEANDVRWARVKVFQTLSDRIAAAIAKRKSVPELISRTAAAQPFMKTLRSEMAAEDEATMQGVNAQTVEVAHA